MPPNQLMLCMDYMVAPHTIMIDSCVGNQQATTNTKLLAHDSISNHYEKNLAARQIPPVKATSTSSCARICTPRKHVGEDAQLENGR